MVERISHSPSGRAGAEVGISKSSSAIFANYLRYDTICATRLPATMFSHSRQSGTMYKMFEDPIQIQHHPCSPIEGFPLIRFSGCCEWRGTERTIAALVTPATCRLLM